MPWRRRRMAGGASSASPLIGGSPCPPSARRSPTTTPIVASACRRTWCKAYATTSAPTATSASTAPAPSTRAGPRTGRKFRSDKRLRPFVSSATRFYTEKEHKHAEGSATDYFGGKSAGNVGRSRLGARGQENQHPGVHGHGYRQPRHDPDGRRQAWGGQESVCGTSLGND